MTLTSMLAGLFLLILVLLAMKGKNSTYTELSFCGLEGANMKVSLNNSSMIQYSDFYWFKRNHKWKWMDKTNPESLLEDPEYQGRFICHGSNVEIRGLRKSDRDYYQFRFKTETYGWKTSSTKINLMVTNLEIKKGASGTLTCSASCNLSGNPTYVWYKNGQEIYRDEGNSLKVVQEGSYSCALEGNEDLRASAVCVGTDCWDVSYANKTICGLTGSHVDLACTYTYPKGMNVSETLWVKNANLKGRPEDMRVDPEYIGRVQYRQNNRDCTLRILDLRKNDSDTYRFLFKMPDGEYFTSSSLSLSVADLLVYVHSPDVKEGLTVWFWCHTQCGTPQSFEGFEWFKDGQRIQNPTEDNSYFIFNAVGHEDAGRYSCALKGQVGIKSGEVALTVTSSVSILTVVLGVLVLLTAGTLVVLTFVRGKKRNRGGHDVSAHTQTANDSGIHLDVVRRESSLVYNTQEHVYDDPDECDDTYMSLRRGRWHSVYDRVEGGQY